MGVVSRPPCENRLLERDLMQVDPEDGELTLELTLRAEWPLPASISEPRLGSLVAFALREEGASGQWEINLLFTTDARIQVMHREFMDLDSPTDIMTFPYEADEFLPPGMSSQGGDIVISVETAALQAEEAGWSLTDELRFLTLHGLLHVLGWDDADSGRRASMLARQSQLLERWSDYAGAATG